MVKSLNGEVLVVFSHHRNNFIVKYLRGIHGPDKIQVIVRRDLSVINEVGEFGKQKVNVSRVGQQVIASVPHCNWHMHVRQVVVGRCGLKHKRERTPVFISNCTLNLNTYFLARGYCTG